MDVLSLALESAPKALVYAFTILVVGCCVAHALFALRASHAVDPASRDAFERGLIRVVVLAAACLVAALVLRAWGHTVAAFGFAGSFNWENLHLVAMESRWGKSWQKQLAAAIVLVAFTRTINRWGGRGWWLTASGSLMLCYLLPLLGHASGEPGRVLLHGSHIVGGGVWLGTLTATAMASRASVHADAAPDPGSPVRREILAKFSPVAFAGSSLLAATGAAAAWWYLGSVGNLVSTPYGRLLLVKLVLVAAVSACGFLNFRRLRAPATFHPSAPRSNLISAEIAIAAMIVVLTAVLTETEHP